MSALSAMEAAVGDGPAPPIAERPGLQPGQRTLRLVRQSGPDDESRPAIPGAEPRSSSIPGSARAPLTQPILMPSAVISPRPRPVAAQSPVRLTRRGRAVVVALVVVAIAAVALVIAMATAAGAQAASPGQPGSGHRGMHEIVVQQGQTLWSIASAAEPTADPRVVVQQIMAANRMTTADIAAGQVLWVPR